MNNIKEEIKKLNQIFSNTEIFGFPANGRNHLLKTVPKICHSGKPVPYWDYIAYTKLVDSFPETLKEFINKPDFYNNWKGLSVDEKVFILNSYPESYSLVRDKVSIKNLYICEFPDTHNNIDLEKLCTLLIKDVFDLDTPFPINKIQCLKLHRELLAFISKDKLDDTFLLYSKSVDDWTIGLIKNIFEVIEKTNDQEKLKENDMVSLYSMAIAHKLLQTDLFPHDDIAYFINKEKQYAETSSDYDQDFLFDLKQMNDKYSGYYKSESSDNHKKSKSIKIR
jgi:hypothetical protein